MWAICPTSQFCRFFVFFSSFWSNLFSGVSGLFLGLLRGGVKFDLLAGLRVFAVAPCVGRGVSVVSHSGQYPGGGALWFVPLIQCKNHTAGNGQRVRVALSFGRGLSVPVSLSHYRGGVALVRVLSGRSGNIRTGVSNKCSKVKVVALLADLAEFPTES